MNTSFQSISVKMVFFLGWFILSAFGAGDFSVYYTRTPYEDSLGGKYADAVVQFPDNRQFVFSRETGFLPYLKTPAGRWSVDEIVPRKFKGTRPDPYNLYSYVRIIESGSARAVVHWRYMPDSTYLEFDGVVHELFTITADGKAVRQIRRAVPGEKMDDWENPQNVTIQTFRLTPSGIVEKTLAAAKPLHLPRKPAVGSPVKKADVGKPVVRWTFDEGLNPSRDVTKEKVSGTECAIGGSRSFWKKGISGTALAFDGYYSKVTLQASKTPPVSQGLTLDAWIAPANYPYEWGPIVDRCEWGKKGYYFGVDQRGRLGLMACLGDRWEQLIAPDRIPLKKWTHVAGTFDPSAGIMRLYIDGELKASKEVPKKPIGESKTALQIGLNSMPLRASGLPTIIGFEGLIDEVKMYDTALGSEQILKSYAALKPDVALRERPDLQDRLLPGRSGKTGTFGASYTKLPYYDLWDSMWFTNEYPDIAVTFEEIPTSVVFWRGTNYGFGMVTENNRWMIDQSIETGYDEYGCCEHMSDKQCRFSHVRLIENTDARVVVHWRYAYVAASLQFPWKFPPTNEEWPRYQSWGDEYYTIYPDGVVVRKVNNNANASVYWQDIQFLSPPGQTPEDQVDLQALTVGGIRFWSKITLDTLNLDWTNGTPQNTLGNANMELIHFKSKYNVYLIFPIGTFVSPWGGKGKYSHFMAWNHWPEAQIRSDGRSALFTDRLTHSALAAADNAVFQGNRVLYGFTDRGISSLLPLSLSWNYPPPAKNVQGGRNRGYDPDQRAYVLEAEGSQMSFDLNGSEIRPIVNPCFVVKHWGSRTAKAVLTIDGQPQPSGSDFRQGVMLDTDGTPTLVVWLKKSSQSPVRISLCAGTSSGGR